MGTRMPLRTVTGGVIRMLENILIMSVRNSEWASKQSINVIIISFARP